MSVAAFQEKLAGWASTAGVARIFAAAASWRSLRLVATPTRRGIWAESISQ
jgi:hypothetical protein